MSLRDRLRRALAAFRAKEEEAPKEEKPAERSASRRFPKLHEDSIVHISGRLLGDDDNVRIEFDDNDGATYFFHQQYDETSTLKSEDGDERLRPPVELVRRIQQNGENVDSAFDNEEVVEAFLRSIEEITGHDINADNTLLKRGSWSQGSFSRDWKKVRPSESGWKKKVMH